MNIGIDIRSLMSPYRTGIGEYTHELLNAIFNNDKNNHYFLFYNASSDVSVHIPRWTQPNVHYVSTRFPNKLFNLAQAIAGKPALDRLVIKNAPLNLPAIDRFFSPNLNFSAFSSQTSHFLTIHDISYHLFPSFFNIKQRLWHRAVNPRKLCKEAYRLITPSENTRRDLIRYFHLPPEKIFTIYPGLSETFTRFLALDHAAQQVTQQTVQQIYRLPERFILSLGTIEPRKNIIGIIEAFEHIFPLLPAPHTLVIAGAPGWKNKHIFARIKQSPLQRYIQHIGYVDAEDKPAIYSLAQLFVYPSFYEGFGFPVLEAMAMGCPTITSNRSSLPELTANAAYLVHPHHPEEIAEGIHLLLTNLTLRETLIKKAREQAAHFSWDTAAKQWLTLLAS